MLAASGEQEVAQTISLGWAEVTAASTIIFEYKTDLLATSWKELGHLQSPAQLLERKSQLYRNRKGSQALA